ncbi:DUF2528 family protein [Acinetobacter schindleri]|uniref:DUF2528 family protein n=1 Tax=Acinetobacter schindleri TaxID=108981 RepID=UPI0022F3DF74|nr:DUF2528 family protein [Acinetobacter schindleri]WBX39006.1 DUF2528 family protein [Acinetobacter schindleri]
MSEIENKTPEVPAYLQCEPRTYEVKLNDTHEFTCELDLTVVIKCTDEMLHEHNDFWSNSESRLEENDGDIVAVILKMIGRKAFWHCYGQNFISPSTKYGINRIFQDEGWGPECFEITRVRFDNYVNDEEFEIKPVQVEG